MSCVQRGFHREIFQIEVPLCQRSEGERCPEERSLVSGLQSLTKLLISVKSLAHVLWPFVVRNVRLTGTLGRYQVRKATYR